MRQRIPTPEDFRHTVSAHVYSAGLATQAETDRAMWTICYLCGRFLGPGRIYLEDAHAPGTFCHLSCFHRYHVLEKWYEKAMEDGRHSPSVA